MDKIIQFVLVLVAHFFSYVYEHRVFYLMMFALLGLICHIAGEAVQKKFLNMIIQGQEVTFNYKPLAFSLSIGGWLIMIIAAILLYFAGGYDPFFEKMGW